MERRIDRVADTRSRIERAALKHFVEKGIAETSIRDIATEADISLGAMYNHFKSKDELSQYLFNSILNELSREMSYRALSKMPFPAKVESMVEYLFRQFDADWLLTAFACTSRHKHLRENPDHPGNPMLIFRQLISDAMDKREIPKGDVDLKAAMMIGAIVQVIDSAILNRFKRPLAALAPATAALCVKMVS